MQARERCSPPLTGGIRPYAPCHARHRTHRHRNAPIINEFLACRGRNPGSGSLHKYARLKLQYPALRPRYGAHACPSIGLIYAHRDREHTALCPVSVGLIRRRAILSFIVRVDCSRLQNVPNELLASEKTPGRLVRPSARRPLSPCGPAEPAAISLLLLLHAGLSLPLAAAHGLSLLSERPLSLCGPGAGPCSWLRSWRESRSLSGLWFAGCRGREGGGAEEAPQPWLGGGC